MKLSYHLFGAFIFLFALGGGLWGQTANISPVGGSGNQPSKVTQARHSVGFVGSDGVGVSEEEYQRQQSEGKIIPSSSNMLDIVLKGLEESPEDFQRFEWQYGEGGIYNESGVRIISIKENVKENFAARISKLSTHKGIHQLELRDQGGQLAVTVSGIAVTQFFDLVKSTVED